MGEREREKEITDDSNLTDAFLQEPYSSFFELGTSFLLFLYSIINRIINGI